MFFCTLLTLIGQFKESVGKALQWVSYICEENQVDKWTRHNCYAAIWSPVGQTPGTCVSTSQTLQCWVEAGASAVSSLIVVLCRGYRCRLCKVYLCFNGKTVLVVSVVSSCGGSVSSSWSVFPVERAAEGVHVVLCREGAACHDGGSARAPWFCLPTISQGWESCGTLF